MSRSLQIGFALEYSLGHTTHAENLKRVLQTNPDIKPAYVDLPFHNTPGVWAKLPGIRSNWSLRASLGAYLGLRRYRKTLKSALFHTQVTSLFSAGLMRQIPSVVSLDATPLQFDELAAIYNYTPPTNAKLEALKNRLNKRAFDAAQHLVTWSQWTKNSLIADYGMSAEKITVIPPGIDTAKWQFSRHTKPSGEPLNLLFVGGDFARKGGDTLLEAFQRLPDSLNAHLHLVTKAAPDAEKVQNVTVHQGVAPNSERLLRLFANADIFVFPTRGDCLPLAVMEAMAAGLPVITTEVGALAEAITDGETGYVVPPEDAAALERAMTRLASDSILRTQMGQAARQTSLERFDAAMNYRKLVDILKHYASP